MAGESGAAATRSKLSEVMGSVLSPVAMDVNDVFFFHGRHDSLFPLLDDHSDSQSFQSGSSEDLKDDDDDTSSSASSDESTKMHDLEDAALEPVAAQKIAPSAATPIFVKLLFDGKPASITDLERIERSVSVSVMLSVFSEKRRRNDAPTNLPPSHLDASLALAGLLNAVVAEQTLERLRSCGPTIEAPDLRLAKSCLRKARDVVTSSIELFFYASKTDSLVRASATLFCEADVEHGFKLLAESLVSNQDVPFRTFGDGFIATVTDLGSQHLLFWCFLNLRKPQGTIVVEVYHPAGLETASVVLESVHHLLVDTCHVVNQRLLLQRLHQGRLASRYLIPPDDVHPDSSPPDDSQYIVGMFDCPVVFRTTFQLFHRCATNPSQVARTVEATVMHIFSISNRRQVFVYKDEVGSIFYMRLVASGGGVDPDGIVELVVQGVDDPGPSVTSQLTAIIQKRLQQIAVDVLSAVLTKNPSFNWKAPDLTFVRSFESIWNKLEGNTQDVSTLDKVRMYEFPDEELFDPGMILLCLRQNLCGSTYFNRLNTGDSKAVAIQLDASIKIEDFGLQFYYNNAPSKLDPKFQQISTLTSKGAEYARAAGTGLAIIDVELFSSSGRPVDRVRIGTRPAVSPLVRLQPESISFTQISERSGFVPYVKVTITGTALDATVLHNWVLLSLNQTLLSWAIERHLECMQLGLWVEPPTNANRAQSEDARMKEIGKLVPGLPLFSKLLSVSHAMPHPAVLRCELEGVIRSSSVATVALELLEKSVEVSRQGLCVIRLSRDETPRLVDLRRSVDGTYILAYDLSGTSTAPLAIQDAPIDCPEYLCFFFTREYDKKRVKDAATGAPKLFEEVTLSDGSGAEPLQVLVDLKLHHPSLFGRSSAFIFSIKRNRRVLLAYNWTPQHFKHTVTRLKERNAAALIATHQSINSLQLRCLQGLSPLPTAVQRSPRKAPRTISRRSSSDVTVANTSSSITAPASTDSQPVTTGKRAIRPAMIRKPKLIGQSIEGAAAHAVAASRARASSNMFRSGAASAGSSVATKRSQPEEPADAQSVRSGTRVPERGKSSLSSVSEPSEDEALQNAKRQYKATLDVSNRSVRTHGLQQQAVRSLATSTLIESEGKPPAVSVIDFLLSRSSVSWSDVAELVHLPVSALSSLLESFTQTITTWIPGFQVLRVLDQPDQSWVGPVMLIGETKAVRNCKCVTVISFKVVQRFNRAFVKTRGFVVTLPRHKIKPGAVSRKPPIRSDLLLYEKDSAALDVLGSTSQAMIGVRRLLFDYIASAAERCSRSSDSFVSDPGEGMVLLRRLLTQSDLSLQTEVLRTNFKVFECPIILRSYGDSRIASIPAHELFQWLFQHAESRTLVRCRPQGLCLPRQVVCGVGIQATVYLACQPDANDRMVALVSVRTNGRDLREYLFRDGSCVAVSTLNYIAIEAAGLIYDELQAAATSLRLATLWRGLARKNPRASFTKSSRHAADARELLELGKSYPLATVLTDPSDGRALARLLDGEVDWRFCLESMARDAGFSPCWELSSGEAVGGGEGDGGNAALVHLYYVSSEDAFVLVCSNIHGASSPLDVSVVVQQERPTGDERLVRVAQMVANYFVYCLWSDVLS